ncbi:MAG: hypothetical protein HGA78_05375, partial [Nitrospirales bacterium]|nr:hypothetical protein [Nitrospirales bacterium]
MRFALISDTHFGDPMGTLIKGDRSLGDRYSAFRDAAGHDNDYLILLGDILDFSISSYKDTYEAAKVFFLQVQKDNIAREMIYLPGNHDADLWHTVEHQVNIIYQLENERSPIPF